MSKPPAKTKPKPPPYPRPVPLVVAEELPPTSADIAWQNGTRDGQERDDADNDSEQRAAKRRRIEACATAYLRGEQLYIMSAQLKGPFQQGWKNPWAKKRKIKRAAGGEENKSLEIAETTKKTSTRVDEETTDKLAIADTTQRFTSPESRTRGFRGRNSNLQHPPSPFVDVANKAQKSPLDLESKVPPKAKERRVEEWLRRNESFAKKSEVQVLSSPTPLPRPHGSPRDSPGAGIAPQTSQSEPILGNESFSLTFHPESSAGLRRSRRISEAVQQVQRASRDMQTVMTETAAPEPGLLHDEVKRMVGALPNSTLDSSRAEFAILKAKRGSVEKAPAKSHLSPFEFKKMARGREQQAQHEASAEGVEPVGENGVPLVVNLQHSQGSDVMLDGDLQEKLTKSKHGIGDGELDIDKDRARMAAPPRRRLKTHSTVENDEPLSNHLANQLQSAPEGADAAGGTVRPALTTAASEVSTTDLLPSAQPRLEPQHSTSSAIRDDKLQSIRSIDPTAEEASRPALDSSISENARPTENDKITKLLPDIGEEHGQSTPDTAKKMAEADEQDQPNDVEPPEMVTVKKSRQSAKNEAPTAATKAKSNRKRKTASFALDPSSMSSHGSIQDVMKARISKKLDSPPPFVFGKDDLDIEVSDEERESVRKRPRPLSATSQPKSILKSANPAVSPMTLRRSKSGLSTEQGPDEQNANLLAIPSGQNKMDKDNFDLDAAIDDLGSFLGTWDAEKEASSMDIEV